MSTHNLCFEQKYENYQNFLSENFHVLVVKFSVYLNRHGFAMIQRCKVMNIAFTSMQPDDVASTLMRCCINVMCPFE